MSGCSREVPSSENTPPKTETLSNESALGSTVEKTASSSSPAGLSKLPANTLVLLSHTREGGVASGESGSASISANGDIVVFESNAPDLFPQGVQGKFASFVFDNVEKKLSRIGPPGEGSGRRPSVSNDAMVVVFQSQYSGYVDSDKNESTDIFAFDRSTKNITRVSVSSDGTEGDGNSYGAKVSANGRYVVFASTATNLVTNDINATTDIFLHDRQFSTTTRISVDSDGLAPLDKNSPSYEVAISADGKFVVFSSYSTKLVSLNTKGFSNIFIHDVLAGATSLISFGMGNEPAIGDSSQPSVSADGRYVAFASGAENLVTDDTNGNSDIFLHDRKYNTTLLLTRGMDVDGGSGANGFSTNPQISSDAQAVVFRSQASNLVERDTNGFEDVFVYFVETGMIQKVGNVESDGRSRDPAISADATHVVFTSEASNLITGDINRLPDVFMSRIQ